MSKLERLLAPGSAELPDCVCGAEMRLVGSKKCSNQDGTEVRHYECPDCKHELRLTVWSDEPIPISPNSGL